MGVKLEGNSRSYVACNVVHESGAHLQTMAPKDNGGDGSGFSPTDLLVTAFGSCVITTLGLYAHRNNIPLKKVSFALEKTMSSDLPRKVARISGVFHLQFMDDFENREPERLKAFIKVGRECPVALSLASSVQVDCSFEVN